MKSPIPVDSGQQIMKIQINTFKFLILIIKQIKI